MHVNVNSKTQNKKILKNVLEPTPRPRTSHAKCVKHLDER